MAKSATRAVTSLSLLLTLCASVVLATSPAEAATYTVRSGDTLWMIAQRHSVSVAQLAAANGISDPNRIHPGQLLQLPGAAAQATASIQGHAPATFRVTATALNVRSGPSTAHRVVGTLRQGARVTANGVCGAWRRIVVQGGTAWVHGAYLTASSPAASSGPPAAPAAPAAPGATGSANPAGPTPAVRRASTTRRVGTDQVNATLVRSTTSIHRRTSASFETDTSLNVKLMSYQSRVVGVRRAVEMTGLGGSNPQTRRSYELTLLNRTRINFAGSPGSQHGLTRSVALPTFTTTVDVGPIPVRIVGRVGVTMSFTARTPRIAGGALSVGFTGTIGVSGTVEGSVGVNALRVGVQGRLDILRASVPATAELSLRRIAYDVPLVLSSTMGIEVFADVSIASLSRRFSYDVPFLRYTLAPRTFSVARGELRPFN